VQRQQVAGGLGVGQKGQGGQDEQGQQAGQRAAWHGRVSLVPWGFLLFFAVLGDKRFAGL